MLSVSTILGNLLTNLLDENTQYVLVAVDPEGELGGEHGVAVTNVPDKDEVANILREAAEAMRTGIPRRRDRPPQN